MMWKQQSTASKAQSNMLRKPSKTSFRGRAWSSGLSVSLLYLNGSDRRSTRSTDTSFNMGWGRRMSTSATNRTIVIFAFVTTALQATQIAVRTRQEEKLNALRNALVNSALAGAPDETIQQIFLNHVDSPTAWRLRVLAFLCDPSTVLKDRVERLGAA